MLTSLDQIPYNLKAWNTTYLLMIPKFLFWVGTFPLNSSLIKHHLSRHLKPDKSKTELDSLLHQPPHLSHTHISPMAVKGNSIPPLA